MKAKVITLSVLSLLSISTLFAQDRTTVSAYNSEISDNLDLRAVASIFGDSRDLADFERRLNDPKIQISNLDLNEDNQVDYLRVIETVEGNAHLIVIQSVLGRDTYQDVATVEVERDRNNRVQVQVVGDVYMYGPNYIYEPVYTYTPVIYTTFWVGNYRPYYSSWYWGYYPSYYYAWSPCPIFRYRSHIGITINFNHHYNYVNYRRCGVAYNSYYRAGRRGNAYEVRYPNRSFQVRNTGYANRHELDRNRNIRTVGTREFTNNSPRNNNTAGISPRVNPYTRAESPRSANTQASSPRTNGNPRSESPRTVVTNGNPRSESPRSVRNEQVSPRVNSNQGYDSPRSTAPRGNTQSYETPPRGYANQGNQSPRAESPRANAPREMSSPRGNSGGQREVASPRGNGGGQREMSSQRGGSQRNESGSRGNRRS
ncbi:MAG: hypothetical protein ACK4ON_05005 [Bacteroidia bacterium]